MVTRADAVLRHGLSVPMKRRYVEMEIQFRPIGKLKLECFDRAAIVVFRKGSRADRPVTSHFSKQLRELRILLWNADVTGGRVKTKRSLESQPHFFIGQVAEKTEVDVFGLFRSSGLAFGS